MRGNLLDLKGFFLGGYTVIGKWEIFEGFLEIQGYFNERFFGNTGMVYNNGRWI